MKKQVSNDYYLQKKYTRLGRFISYFYQISYIRKSKKTKVLFIGVGDGMVADFLRKSLDIVTLDIDQALNPDVVGDIRALSFKDREFDVVCAFEVLEHMPLSDSEKALTELARVSKGDVLISVPHRRVGIEFVCRFPFIQTLLKRERIRVALRIPVRFPGFAVSKQHYWEIDGWSLSLKKFRNILRKNFSIEKEETPVLDMYIRFFILKKKQ